MVRLSFSSIEQGVHVTPSFQRACTFNVLSHQTPSSPSSSLRLSTSPPMLHDMLPLVSLCASGPRWQTPGQAHAHAGMSNTLSCLAEKPLPS